jgi:Rad3-related DNA helicase
MTWNLYQKEEFLKPLIFSNGKTQEDVVKEVLDAVKKGDKIIFIHGICGTGKSAIALNIARKLGKTSIVVPGKNLQTQYKKDYEHNKYLLKDNKEKLKISVITGRNNHKCKFLEDHKNLIPKIKKEVNSKLYDIFAGKREEIENTINKDISADNYTIPCKIEIKEKNSYKIKSYLKQNKNVNENNFSKISEVKRMSIAPICPYWSPVMPEKYEIKQFSNIKSKQYEGIGGKFIFYPRKVGCGFYEQFNDYLDSDVIVFNSSKYKNETTLGRKPLTEIEIIDECDEFLDSFSSQKNINIDRFQNSLIRLFSENKELEKVIRELSQVVKQIKQNKRVNDSVFSQEIIPLKETGIYDLFQIIIKNYGLFEEFDEENYIFDVEETTRMFDEFLDESFITFSKRDNNLIASIVTTNLAKKFKEMIDKNKIFVLMSGTIHSENVLKNIFGLENFKSIKAETEKQGRIEIKKTGMEMDCKYSNFSSGKFTKKDYFNTLDKCIEIAKKPALIHVNAFSDLPSEQEIEEYQLKNLVSKEKLKEEQIEKKNGELIADFKEGKTNILFSTRASRGIDFPGEQCNSIIFTKYPNPNVQDAFWKILNKTKPNHYWDFYKDKAKRELWQKIYRGLRFKEDHVYVLSPDLRVLEAFENK